MAKLSDARLARKFKRRALSALPGRVAKVVLFGSRARGDGGEDSDWDIAVFVRDRADAKDVCALADAAYDLIIETGQFIQPLALSIGQEEDDSLLIRQIRKEGVRI